MTLARTLTSLFAGLLLVLPAFAVPLDPDMRIRPDLLGKALSALETHETSRPRSDRLVIVDYSKRSDEKRLFVVHLDTGKVDAFRTTHGRGSDADHDGFLDTFSDEPGSSASPEGTYRLAEEYYGKHGRSIRLDGLDTTNANARDRAIVIHAADYAEPDMIARYGKLGRSNGCIVFSAEDLKTFLADVPEGTLIFVGR